MSAKSKFWPPNPHPVFPAAITARLCSTSVAGGTPVASCPQTNAAVPPVLLSLLVLTPACLSIRNLGCLFLYSFRRWLTTVAFRRVPAANPTPRDLVRMTGRMPCTLSSVAITAVKLGLDAKQTDLVAETSPPAALMPTHTDLRKPTKLALMKSSWPATSADRSST